MSIMVIQTERFIFPHVSQQQMVDRALVRNLSVFLHSMIMGWFLDTSFGRGGGPRKGSSGGVREARARAASAQFGLRWSAGPGWFLARSAGVSQPRSLAVVRYLSRGRLGSPEGVGHLAAPRGTDHGLRLLQPEVPGVGKPVQYF
jgi:hypothetical protein